MKQSVLFILMLGKEVLHDELISLANELTYKLLLALFPFIIFFMTIIGFSDIKVDSVLDLLSGVFPDQVLLIINSFLNEVVTGSSIGLLSSSLFVSIISASSGFSAIVRGINKTYGQKETRNFIKLHAISIILVLLFAFAIFSSIVLLIFGDSIINLLSLYLNLTLYFKYFLSYLLVIGAMAIILFAVMLIYKIGLNKKITIRKMFPGALTTVFLWVLSSKIFNIYIHNFSKHSKVYGSIGSIFILMLWLNIISFLLLLGSEINSLIENNKLTKNS